MKLICVYEETAMPFSMLALLMASGGIAATPPLPPPPPGCAARTHAEQHQFDFWIGRWEVTGAGGKIAGHSRIEPVSDGCGISEHWEGTSGSRGVSYNAWDPSSGHWHQFWIGNTPGDVLWLEGGIDGGRMVMQGVRNNPATNKPQRQRITWTPNAAGTVRQLWETSDDDGATWVVSFDGNYQRKLK
jgi:hypothetical protein